MGSYNNWNIIHLSPKPTHFKEFGDIHQVVLDSISDNMASLVQPGKYSVINTADIKKDFILFNSSQRNTRFKIIQQFMDKLFLRVN